MALLYKMRGIAQSDSSYVFWTDSEPDLDGSSAPESVDTDSIIILSVGGQEGDRFNMRAIASSDSSYVFWTDTEPDLDGSNAPETVDTDTIVVYGFLPASVSIPDIFITSVPTTLFEQQPTTSSDAIDGTTDASDGSTATAYINGVEFGTATVSGGTFSITGTPTSAMVGDSVDVEVVIEEGSVTSTTNVKPGTANWDAKRGVTVATGVSAWVDQIGGISADQSDTAKQPAYPGSSSVDFDGTDDNLLLDGDVTTDTSHIIVVAVDLDRDDINSYIMDSPNGRLVLASYGIVARQWAFYDVTWRAFSDASTGKHIVAYVFDGVTDLADMWVDGTKISAYAYQARPIGGNTIFGANQGASSRFWDGDIYNIYIASGSSVPLTDAEVQALMKQIDDYHGLGVIP